MEVEEYVDSFEKVTFKSDEDVYWPETQYWVCGDYPDETREMYCYSALEARDYIEELERRPGLISIRIASMIPFAGKQYVYSDGKKIDSIDVTLSTGDVADF